MKKLILLLFVSTVLANVAFSQKKKKQSASAAAPSATQVAHNGFIDFYYDNKADKIFLKIDRLEEEFLYVNSLATGVGSNDIGLDRGQLGNERVVKFVKAGNKLLLVQPNYKFRAISDNPDEAASVEQAFAHSVLWGSKIIRKEGNAYILDATNFLMRDAHGVTGTLSRSGQGNYSLDKTRSALYLDRTKNFPENTEFEVTLTFAGKPKGGYIRSVAPSADAVTVRQHHSFVKLPDDAYVPRKFDPRSGFFGITYFDYATPISEKLEQKFIARHRLEKKDPSAAISEAKEPIIYYLDRGAPEPIRSALMEGAAWWNQAFEAIGYKDAFQVKLLPEGVDPMDVRYNLIQWVHRSTRGWSYGGSVTDPRTGEIIKGHVSLGSLRVRQDFLIAQGMLGPFKNNDNNNQPMEALALARLRQLSAHEVGHTIGLAHSYTSSTEGKASVMDYPHPQFELKNGGIDASNAYDNKIGAWDKVSVAYGYQDFEEGVDEKTELEKIIQGGFKNGLTFLSDQDARPQGSAHPNAHLWDNGKDVVNELNTVLELRKVALNNFGVHNIRTGENMASLEEVLTPVYYFHRYQVEAAVKVVGGLEYRYAKRGDGQFSTKLVDPEWQKRALKSVLQTVSDETLTLNEHIIAMIPPRPMGHYRNREIVNNRTGLTFDPITAAESYANLAFKLLLNHQKASRMVELHARHADQPSLAYVLEQSSNATWKNNNSQKGLQAAVHRAVDFVYLDNLMQLAASNYASNEAKSMAYYELESLSKYMIQNKKSASSEELKAHFAYGARQIDTFFNNPEKYEVNGATKLPDGSPIGSDPMCSFE